MNIPPGIEQKLRNAITIDDLKETIQNILDEYTFGILSELEERIDTLEDKMERDMGTKTDGKGTELDKLDAAAIRAIMHMINIKGATKRRNSLNVLAHTFQSYIDICNTEAKE